MACIIEIARSDLKFVPNMARRRLNELVILKQKKGKFVRLLSHLDIEIQRAEEAKEELVKKLGEGPARRIY